MKRYEMTAEYNSVGCYDEVIPVESDNGDWIKFADYQAATEAAKATGTAGELSEDAILNLAKAHGFTTTQILSRGPELIGGSVELHERFMKFGQACANAARQPAPVDQPIGPISDWTLPRLYDLACRQRHEIRESDKCIKRYADELVAVRQSSQMPKVKIWQDRFEESYGRNPFDGELVIDERDEEIADLRAALAATAAPVVDIEQLIGIIRSFGYTTYSQSREIAEALAARSQP